jgi:hypothetical protein
MSKHQLIGTLKQVQTVSKVDDRGREIHTVSAKIELIENKGRDEMQEIAKQLNKPIRLDFDAVQLELGEEA